jgi:nucleoid-associated protein YgaU
MGRESIMSLPRKSVAAAIVLLVGLTAAWLFFRRDANDAEQAPSTTTERLVIREPAASPWTKPAPAPELPWQKDASRGAVPEQPTAEPAQAHLEPPQPVPAAAGIAKDPSPDLSARFAQALGSPAPSTDAFRSFAAPQDSRESPRVAGLPASDAGRIATPRVHRIVDGDTLGRLAERYLGSTQRQSEIFDANRDKLRDPDLLPIGVELRIPADLPLTPVPPGALRSPNQ